MLKIVYLLTITNISSKAVILKTYFNIIHMIPKINSQDFLEKLDLSLDISDLFYKVIIPVTLC